MKKSLMDQSKSSLHSGNKKILKSPFKQKQYWKLYKFSYFFNFLESKRWKSVLFGDNFFTCRHKDAFTFQRPLFLKDEFFHFFVDHSLQIFLLFFLRLIIKIVCFDKILIHLFWGLFWIWHDIDFSLFLFVFVNVRSTFALNLTARIVLSIIEHLWLLTVPNVDLFILGKFLLIGLILISFILDTRLLLIHFFRKLVLSLIKVNCLLCSFLLILIRSCILWSDIFNLLFLVLILFDYFSIHSKNLQQLLLSFRLRK